MTFLDLTKKTEDAAATAQAVHAAIGNHTAMMAALDAHMESQKVLSEHVAQMKKEELARRRRPWWCWCFRQA